MRLGGPVFDTADDPQTLVDYHRKFGFSAAYVPHVDDPVKVAEVQAAFAEANILLAEYGAYAINLLETDPVLRQKNIDEICRRLEYADQVGARCCVIHGGSYESGGWGKPNPENFSERAFDETAKAVQSIVDTVQPAHARLVMETEKYVLPDDPDVYLRLVQAVDRPSFGVHLDPVNIISCPKLFYTNGEFVKNCFAKLATYIVSCHSKDVITASHYPYHISETYTGNGVLDYGVYLTELSKLAADMPLMIEHLNAEQLPKAVDFLLRKAEEVGVLLVKPVPATYS
jgi:sugar phosphate isomerase/epimerase